MLFRSITNYSRATDMDGISIYSQIIDYMESKVFLEEFNKLQINYVEANQQELSTFDLEKERKETDQRIVAIDLPKEEIAPDQWEQIEIHNPADVILEKRSIGVFSILIKDQSTISNKGISLQQQPSQRKLNKGNWNQVNKNNISSNFNKFLLLKYLEEKCGNYVLPNKEGPLSYPMEYILAKQDNDFDNLKLVCDKLIRVREASNFFYLLSDQKKLMEVETLAASLSAVILVPELQPLIKYSIILAWAFAESVNDVKILLNNGKIPIIKSDKEWKLSLEAMLNFEGNLTSEPANTSGLEYQDYLKLLLYIQEEKDILLYFMDIVETDLRKENQYFYIDGCINAVDVNFCITSSYGYQFNFSRNYSY